MASGPEKPSQTSSGHAGPSPFVYLGALIVTFLLADFGGLLSSFLSGNGWPSHHTPSLVALWSHASDPSAAWHVPVGPVWFYWLTTVLVIAVAIGGPWYLIARVKNRSRNRATDLDKLPGFARPREVRAVAGKRRILLARAKILRPSLVKALPGDLGFLLGSSRRVDVYISIESSLICIAPPRIGKSRFISINLILRTPPGSCLLTTNTRPDALAATYFDRAAKGPVMVFDCENLAEGLPRGYRFNLAHGCDDPRVAIRRATSLATNAADGIEGGAYWLGRCQAVIRCFLYAANIAGLGAADLYRWSVSPTAASEAVTILQSSAMAQWARDLDDVVTMEPRQRASIWGLVSNTFMALADPLVVDQFTSNGDEPEFNPESFLRHGDGTIYLLGTASGHTSNIVTALVDAVVDTARHLAAASPGARLDPPLTLVLDEAANFPLPNLDSLLSEGSGSGIFTAVFVQSMAQIRDRWGFEKAGAIWDAASVKLILGGSSTKDLQDLSSLIGDYVDIDTSTTDHENGGRSTSTSSRRRPVLELSTIREMKESWALMLVPRSKPIALRMTSWDDAGTRRDAKKLRQGKQKVEEMLQRAAIAKRAAREASES
jgi:type IV secretion system protein VirD4